MDLSNQEIFVYAAIKTWPDRWEECRKDLVTEKVLKKETPDSGDIMSEDTSETPSQVIQIPWDKIIIDFLREPKVEERVERSYKEFAQDLQKRAKHKENNKGKGTGMKYTRALKEKKWEISHNLLPIH